MKAKLTIQEKLKDLRVDCSLTLEQLAAETKISKTALNSYETDELKDIPHTIIAKLAKYYGVSTDYLLRLTENIKYRSMNLKLMMLWQNFCNPITSITACSVSLPHIRHFQN